VRDRALREKMEAYRVAVRALGAASAASARGLAASAQKMAPALAEATSAAADLDRACASPDASCTALATVMKGSGAGESLLDDTPELLAKATLAMRAVHPRRAKVAQARERLAEAVDELEVTGALMRGAGSSLHAACEASGRAAPTPSEWVSAPTTDVRALTVTVSFKPPGSLTGDFEKAAARARDDESGFYRAAAAGGFGSGFVLVRRTSDGVRPFVVTNRHVVDLADHVEVTRNDGEATRARIVYADPHYDLAVLSLDGSGATFDHGFDLDTAGVSDQQAVVAAGFPGLANHPSYQVTKGYVSNERFELDSGDLKLPYIQHTAAIDRGSSGGPLMGDSGKVLGVNTLKAFGREGVAFAVPATAVVGAVRYAATLDAKLEDASFRRQTLRDDCLDLVAELILKDPRVERLEKLVSTRMIAEEGEGAYDAVAEGHDELQKSWSEDPVSAYRTAVALHVRDLVKDGGGIAATETCAQPNAADFTNILTSDRVRIPVQVGMHSAEISMRWEQGRWKLVHLDIAQTAVGRRK
jgi:serine protease Do